MSDAPAVRAGQPREPVTPSLAHVPQLALSAAEVAKLLGVSERHVWALHSSGRLPRPIRLGRAVRWNVAELQAWLDAGAPERFRWETLRQKGRTA